MNQAFYTNQVEQQWNSIDFQNEQSEFQERTDIIEDVQNKYKLYIDHYLEKEQTQWIDAPLFDFIDANWDQENVITYIDFELEKRKKQLSKDDQSQLKDLKSVLEKQDYKEKIHVFPNSVNFWIVWGYYILEDKSYWMVMQEIKKLRKNKYKLLLQREWSKVVDKFEIHYDWSDFVSIYDQFWKHLWRQNINKSNTIFIEWNKYRKQQYQTSWKLHFKPTYNESIELDLIFIA